jgi:hypothetical protein
MATTPPPEPITDVPEPKAESKTEAPASAEKSH